MRSAAQRPDAASAAAQPETGPDAAELAALAETTRRFVAAHVLPHQEEWEARGVLPRALHQHAAHAGLLGASFPEDVGGGGGGLRASLTINEAAHEAGMSGGTFASLFTAGIAVPHFIAAGSRELIDAYVRPTLAGELIGSLAITEPSGGSDVGGLRTRAEHDGDAYVISGEKTFITSGTRADFVVTAARTGGPGAKGVSLLVVPADSPGFSVAKKLAKMGWHSSDTAELHYDAVRVPADHLIGAENAGFAYISQAFVTERVGLAAQAYSGAQRALDLTVQWCRDRVTFGDPLIARPTVQATLAQMTARIDAARVYTRVLAARYDDQQAAPEPQGGLDLVATACFAKNMAVEAAEWCASQAVQLFGGMGYMAESEVERIYRDTRILGIGGGTTEILTALAAKRMGYTA
ncbi:acyl-CoA dehydrogenase [Brevibacterium sp. 5221]|uniref:Acyl-CoA dehydrogenase n=1 Tax=Brevibacterium rongguiense TaxID=2695267 RepID=A0A6N9H515_9MICO|nr:acyl-CoA dehydrogenase family protein [Brevibacterium rongguiense]MYM19120.1 acyl-CoA dehydrogenase [Brevibacterium rongguiense]